ncbi:MAG: PrsW family glutamic-type intramembrane protease [Synechococcales bacterium]|nr:PrsW family glutamic-type intramembrane protease [Synechococcales bacterium]
MTASAPVALLRQLSGQDTGQRQPTYSLVAQQSILIGRDPSCDIVLDSQLYSMVSRRHAELRPHASSDAEVFPNWWLCDLNSSNGTFINDQPLNGCQLIQSGDRITLGLKGPQFRFELLPTVTQPDQFPPAASQRSISAASPMPSTSWQASYAESSSEPLWRDSSNELIFVEEFTQPQASDRVTLTQLFPIFSTGLEITRKAYIVPAIITITFVVALFVTVGQPVAFNLVLAGFWAFAAFFLIYLLCGKRKSWVILIATVLSTIGLLCSPVLTLFIQVFREFLPGEVPKFQEQMPFWLLLIRMFFGAGLMEELLKALPLFFLCLLGTGRSPRWRDRFGIREPLDGILLGTASAVGFTLLETLGQYVPTIIQNATLQAGEELSQLQGLQLLIPRLLGSVVGHMAYSGYFGYAIGLWMLKPNRAWLTLGTGYLTAAVLHTLWNAMGAVSPFILALVGILSYAFLAAAILKARSLSPTRSENFATRLKTN